MVRRYQFRTSPANLRFWGGFAIATLVAILIFPGLDIGAYLVLRPMPEFWERFAFIAGACVIFFPQVFVAFLAWVGVATLFGL